MFENIGPALRLLRKQRGLQQKQVAEAVGTHFATVSRWESGETTPSLERLGRALKVLEVTPRELAVAIEQTHGIAPPEAERPAPALDNPGEALLEEMLVRTARGDDTSEWLLRVERAAEKLRRVHGFAERRLQKISSTGSGEGPPK